MHHPVIRRHIVQSSVLKLFFAHGTLFFTARHRRGMIVDGGSARIESGTRACAVAEDDSFANTAYYVCVSEIILKKCVCNFL